MPDRRLRDCLPKLFLLPALLAACGGGNVFVAFPPPAAANTPMPTPTPTPTPAPTPAPAPGILQVATGLDMPVFLTAPEGDSRQFIVERGGRIRILQNGTLLATPFLDIGAQVSSAGEGGLLSIAFDPRYAANGFFYLYYTDAGNNIVIERRWVSSNPNLAEPGLALPILRIPHPQFVNHFGGLLAFGPDGFLYLGTGDGGGAGDPQGNAQNPNSLLGKMLRLDVSAASAARPYAIPATNPFVGQAGRRPEIWALGLRNPWRFTFDGAQMIIADVGQARREEVDLASLAQGGLNFGWNTLEGSLCYNNAVCSSAGLKLPVFEYDQGAGAVNGCSIIGGFVYRGRAMPQLAGRYFYSDYCGGYLKSIVVAAAGASEQRDWGIPKIGPVLSFGRDADGELYLLAASGTVYKIAPAAARG